MGKERAAGAPAPEQVLDLVQAWLGPDRGSATLPEALAALYLAWEPAREQALAPMLARASGRDWARDWGPGSGLAQVRDWDPVWARGSDRAADLGWAQGWVLAWDQAPGKALRKLRLIPRSQALAVRAASRPAIRATRKS